MNYIIATNATPTNKGKRVVIRSDIILTVYEGMAVRDDGAIEFVTFIYCPDHGTWEVEEGADKIWEQLQHPAK